MGWKASRKIGHVTPALSARSLRESTSVHLLSLMSPPVTPLYSYMKDGQLVCVMPKAYADRLISFHQNCLGNVDVKRANMMNLLNWTYDETMYNEERTTLNRSVYPLW